MNPDGSRREGSAPPITIDRSWGPTSAPEDPGVPSPRRPNGGAPGWWPQPSPVAQPPYPGAQPGAFPGTNPGTYPGPPGYSGPPVSPSGGSSGSGRGVLIAVVVAIVLLAAAGGAFWLVSARSGATVHRPGTSQPGDGGAGPGGGGSSKDGPGGGARGTATRAPEPPLSRAPSSSPTSGQDEPVSEQTARALLESQRAVDAARVTLDGRWVAQVASKYVGITDSVQSASDRSHTFNAVDIWAESRAALDTVSDPDHVYLLTGTDFGRHSPAPNGETFWITVVDDGFSSEADVRTWCAETYPDLTGEQLANTCAPGTLSPPS